MEKDVVQLKNKLFKIGDIIMHITEHDILLVTENDYFPWVEGWLAYMGKDSGFITQQNPLSNYVKIGEIN